MTSSRETIYAALFSLLKQAPGLVFSTRRATPFSQLLSENKTPALIQLERDENPEGASRPDPRMPYVWALNVTALVWVASTSDPIFVPATPLNNILDYITIQIPPSLPAPAVAPYGVGAVRQTLGIKGVQSVCLAGAIEKDEGVLAPHSYAAVPIRIITV